MPPLSSRNRVNRPRSARFRTSAPPSSFRIWSNKPLRQRNAGATRPGPAARRARCRADGAPSPSVAASRDSRSGRSPIPTPDARRGAPLVPRTPPPGKAHSIARFLRPACSASRSSSASRFSSQRRMRCSEPRRVHLDRQDEARVGGPLCRAQRVGIERRAGRVSQERSNDRPRR